ncbi:MAG: hypothetical protein V5B33_07975 [Candidatus Accumulibacter sp. UW20]|jgi:hypothetical protein
MKYIALRNIMSSGDEYEAGEEIELDHEEAKHLLQIGAIEPFNKPFSGTIRHAYPDVQTKDGELNALLQAVRKAADAILVKIQKADEEMSVLEAERTSLTDSPVSRDDLMAYVRADIARRGAPYQFTLSHWKNKWFHNAFSRWERAEQGNRNQAIPYLNAEQSHEGAEMTPGALYFLFGDLIAERFAEALKVLPFPENAVPVEQRRARIAAIDAELDRLNAHRAELVGELSAVGVSE